MNQSQKVLQSFFETKNQIASNYKKRQLLLHLQIAQCSTKPKLFTGHTQKIFFVHPDKMPSTVSAEKINETFESEQELENDDDEAISTQQSQNKKKLGKIIHYRPTFKRQEYKQEPAKLYFHMEKKKVNQSSLKLPSLKLKKDSLSRSFIPYNQNEYVLDISKEREKSEKCIQKHKFVQPRQNYNAQRQATQNMKAFNYIINDFHSKEQNLEESDIEDFTEYVSTQKYQ